MDKVGFLKDFEEALGGGGGADVEIDIIAEQLIASSFHLCAVHHFLGHFSNINADKSCFFLSCSFLAITIATRGIDRRTQNGNQPISSTFCILPFLIVANLGPGSAVDICDCCYR